MGSHGVALYLQRFFDKMDLILGLLVKTGAGLLGKSVMRLKSLCMIRHLFARISCTKGRHLVNWTHNGVGLSLNNLIILGFNMFSRLVCFIFQILFKIRLLYPLRARCFINCLLYFRQMIGDVVLRITQVISPMAMPLWMCAGMKLVLRGKEKVFVGL